MSQCPLSPKNRNVKTLVIPKGALNPNDTHVIEIPDDNDVKSFILPTRNRQSCGSARSSPYQRTVAEPAEYQSRQQCSAPRPRMAPQYIAAPSRPLPSMVPPPPVVCPACSQMQSGRLLAATALNSQPNPYSPQRFNHNSKDCPLHSMANTQQCPLGYGSRPTYEFARQPSPKPARIILAQCPAINSKILHPYNMMETNDSYAWLPPNVSRSESFLSCSQPLDDDDDDIDQVIEEKIHQIMKPFLRSLMKSVNPPDSAKTCDICGKISDSEAVGNNRMKKATSRVKFNGGQEGGSGSGSSNRQDNVRKNGTAKLPKRVKEETFNGDKRIYEEFEDEDSEFNRAFLSLDNEPPI